MVCYWEVICQYNGGSLPNIDYTKDQKSDMVQSVMSTYYKMDTM